jgi:hypothetical protein
MKTEVTGAASYKMSRRGRLGWDRPAAWFLLFLASGILVDKKANADAPCESSASACPGPVSAETARGIALGTGVRASAISTAALAYNTAGLTLGKVYHLEGIFDLQSDRDMIGIGAAVVDSATSALSAGLSIRGLIENGQQGLNGIDAYLGLAFPLIDMLSIGVGGRYINLWSPHGFDDNERRDFYDYRLTKGFTFDAAVRLSPIEWMHLAALAYNIVNRRSAYVPTVVGASVAVTPMRSLVIGSDSLVDLSSFGKARPVIGAGAEYLADPGIPLRLGYSYDTGRKIQRLTGGIGYTSQSFGLDVSLQQAIKGSDETRVMAGLRIYVI